MRVRIDIKKLALESMEFVFRSIFSILRILGKFCRKFQKYDDSKNVGAFASAAFRIREKEKFEEYLRDKTTGKVSKLYTEERNCPCCGSSDKEILFASQDGFDYVVCKKCGMIYVSPVITNYHWKKLKHDHPDYFSASTERTDKIISEEGYKNEIIRYRKYFASIKKYKKKGKLLDIGCGCGNSIRNFNELGYEAIGIEANPEFWGDLTSFRKQHNIEIYDGYFDEELPLAISSNKFDVITFWESLEHIVSPKIALQQAFNLLVPEGIVAITVPNWDCFENRLLREHSSVLRGEGHINMFNHHTLKTLLNICGFEILEIETIGVDDINYILNYLSLELDRTNSYANYGKYQKETKYRVQRYFSPDIETILKTKFFKLLLYGYERVSLKGPLLFVIAGKLPKHAEVNLPLTCVVLQLVTEGFGGVCDARRTI